MCNVDSNWITIGYVVREALDCVHTVLAAEKIIYVKFAWVKYMVNWVRSGPGFYAGINVALNGEWPKEVSLCQYSLATLHPKHYIIIRFVT